MLQCIQRGFELEKGLGGEGWLESGSGERGLDCCWCCCWGTPRGSLPLMGLVGKAEAGHQGCGGGVES